MARPTKDGIDYFPLDVGFLQDKKIKLIKGEFGAKGLMVALQIFCSIYEERGYFTTCDDDDCILMAEAVGCGCDPNFIRQVVQGCLRRSLFDQRIFEVFGVLTSRGIQRRYLRALSTRDNINIVEEYWLLNINDKEDVPASISKKITFKKVSLQNNPVSLQKNEVNLQINPQSKVKQSKEKKSKVKNTFKPPVLQEVIAYAKERESPVDPKQFYDFFTAGDWHDSNGKPVKSWKQKFITWEKFTKKGDGNGDKEPAKPEGNTQAYGNYL
ncbi:DUF4373 domain-containing protein [Aminipila luticellarii]|uniref:DUF4373 domain-containing protein n=1 Tax=Aminipila luticellarii TaxID=2507160 RepID=A0A410PX54_9FIRM|nr:DUF4373 domain-containing protein [Aminipila luticellarii]QAT43466.1 DUF4373 domain-containing protein [Aminipila luticellarii]